MARIILSSIVLALITLLNYSIAESGLEFPVHDGKSRLIDPSKKNFDRFVKKSDILVVYFNVPVDEEDTDNIRHWQLTQQMLELAAQVTEREGINFGIVDLKQDKKLALKLNAFEIGSIYCYHHDHVVEYDGQRSADVLIEFLLELDEHPIETIDTKVELAAFKRNELAKVIGYFESTTSMAYDEFVDAALDFAPMIPFFVTYNRQIAKQLGMKDYGQIQFYEPFMPTPIAMPGSLPHDNVVIEDFVRTHERATLRKLRPIDMYKTWEDEINNIHIVAFADDEDPEGYEFVQILKQVAIMNTDNTELSIVWIDPDDFPLLHSYWEQTYGVDLKEPCFGVVNNTDADSVWMNIKPGSVPNVAEVDKWVNDVLSGVISTEHDDDEYKKSLIGEDDDEDDEDDDLDDMEDDSNEIDDDDDDGDVEDDDDDEEDNPKTEL